MVSETVVDETVEQVTDDAPQAEPVAPAEPEASAADLVSDGEAIVPEAVSEPVVETTEPEAFKPPQTIEELRTQWPDLAKALENAGAQSREAQLKKEAGSKEQTARRVAEIARELGVEVEDPEKLNFAYQLAQDNATDFVMKGVAQSIATKYGYTPEQLSGIEATIAILEGKDLAKYTSQLFDGAVTAGASAVVKELDGPDITEERAPKLYKWVQEQRDEAVAAERAALKRESQAESTPRPMSGSGQIAGNGAVVYETQVAIDSAYARGEMPHEEYMGYKRRGEYQKLPWR